MNYDLKTISMVCAANNYPPRFRLTKVISMVCAANNYPPRFRLTKVFYKKRVRPIKEYSSKRCYYKRCFDPKLYRYPPLDKMYEMTKDFSDTERKPLNEIAVDFIHSIPLKATNDDISRLLFR